MKIFVFKGDRLPTSPAYGPYDQYDRDRYPMPGSDRYPMSGTDRDRYPMTPGTDRDRYPMPGGDRDRYPLPGGERDRYPLPGADRERYPMMPGGDRERYPMPGSDRDRYPMPGYDRDRYPVMPGYDRERFPMMPGYDRERYPMMPGYDKDRYPMMPEYDRDRYPMMPGYDRDRYPMSGYDRDRYPIMPGYDKPYTQPGANYPSRPTTGDPIDSTNPKYPPPSNNYPDSNNAPKDRFIPDDRTPNIGMYPDMRRPPNRGQTIDKPYNVDPMYSVRYPEYPMMPSYNRYPVSENRFPVGNDRFPVNIYKYGNRDRIPMYMPPAMNYPGYEPDNRGYPPMRGQRPPYIMVGFGGNDADYAQGPDMYGAPYGPGRPVSAGTRCDDLDSYKQMGLRQKMRNQFIRRKLRARDLIHCQRECSNSKDFVCRSFNYRDDGERPPPQGVESFNCELSDRDTRELDLNNPQMFENGNYDFYERSIGSRSMDGECLDVSQVCNEDGMEFTLRTGEPFAGRIYTYGFYDR